MSFAAWSSDEHSFLAATVIASYDYRTAEAGNLVRYMLGAVAGQSLAAGYSPWSAL